MTKRVENQKVEMVFSKNEKIKKAFSGWEDLKIQETKKFYKVTVDKGSLFESMFQIIPEFVTTRNYSNQHTTKQGN
jgi:hypothetical protein